MADYGHILKLIAAGDSGVGKTCFLNRFVSGEETHSHYATIGIDFQAKTVTAASGRRHRLQLWDTAGQEQFRAIVGAYYRAIAGALVVFDVTDRRTFDSVDYWLSSIRRGNEHGSDLPVVLVGNKIDAADREVTKEEAIAYARRHGIRYYDTSVSTDTGVTEAMMRLVDDIDARFIATDRVCAGVKVTRLSEPTTVCRRHLRRRKCC